MVALAERVEQRGACEIGGEHAGEPAIGPEQRRARMARALASFMAVGVGGDAETKALLQRVLDQPLESAPVRVHFHRTLETAIVRHLHVRVAPADMGEDDALLAPQGAKECLGIAGVAREVRQITHQGVRGAMDRTAFVQKHDVAVTAQRGVARPFVAREDDKPAIAVVFARERVELVPEARRDLEIVALMAHGVEEGAVARELDQLACRVGADRLLRLAVQVAPVGQQGRLRDDAHRVARAEQPPLGVEHLDRERARLGYREIFEDRRVLAAPHGEMSGKPGDRPAGAERECARHLIARIAPGVLGLEAEAERLA